MDEPMHPGEVLLERVMMRGKLAPLLTNHEMIFVDHYFHKLYDLSEQNDHRLRVYAELLDMLPDHIQAQYVEYRKNLARKRRSSIKQKEALLRRVIAARKDLTTSENTDGEGD